MQWSLNRTSLILMISIDFTLWLEAIINGHQNLL
jgi:hypothetical protein